MTKNVKRNIKRVILLIVSLALEGILAFMLIGGIANHGLAESKVITLIIILMLMIPLALLALLFVVSFRKKQQAKVSKRQETDKKTGKKKKKNEDNGDTERFCMLSAIDRRRNSYGHVKYATNVTLEDFCENFRNYAAYRHGLYYDIEDIRRFIAGMSVSHMLILQGMSGTGKTSLAHAIGSFVDNSSTIIPVQPMWKERTDLIGYYNEFTRRFNETLLLTKMYEANYSKDVYVTVLDEMNIARVEYYFAEFLSLLELPNPDERYLDVVSDKWEKQ